MLATAAKAVQVHYEILASSYRNVYIEYQLLHTVPRNNHPSSMYSACDFTICLHLH